MISGAEEIRKINSIILQKIEKIIDRFSLKMFKVRYELERTETDSGDFPMERYCPKPRRIFDKVTGISDNAYEDISNSELSDYANEIHDILSIDTVVNALCDTGFTSVEDAYFS